MVRDGSTLQVAPASAPSQSSTGLSIIVDDSTIKLPSSTKTITDEDGSIIIVGPTNVVQDGVTVPIPTEPTTVTTEGVKVTFGGRQTLSEASPSPASPITNDQPATATSGDPVITPPSSGESGYIPFTFPPRSSTESQVALTLKGETYILPHAVSVELLQSDEKFITLYSNSIALGSATVSIPPTSSQAKLPLNGILLEVGPTSDSSDNDNGGGGGGGGGLSSLIDGLTGLASTANSIVNTLDGIGEHGVSWAAGEVSNSDFSNDIQDLLDSATSELSGFVSDLSSIIENYGTEMYEMTEDGLRRVFPARTGGVQGLDLLKSLKKLTLDITNLEKGVITKLKDYWIQGSAAAFALAAAEEGLRNFGIYNWDRERKRQPSSTGSNSTSAMSSTQSSSSEAAKQTGTPDEYIITTKTRHRPHYLLSVHQDLAGQG